MSERFTRQTFLGADAQGQIERATLGVVGLGGGGSHIVQQLAHVGFRNFVLYDADIVEESNLNRLVGATSTDAANKVLKLAVASRVIHGQDDSAAIDGYPKRWQDAPEALRRCDVVFGCVDSFAQRDQLEKTCRRHLVPLIDIGLDVIVADHEAPMMGGQLIVSMPGCACMWCIGFLTEARLAEETSRYGDAGPRPQVVWGNGVLASTAVGLVVDLLTNWTRRQRALVYLEYRGNDGTMRVHPRTTDKGMPAMCPHYPTANVGEPVFRTL